MPRAVKCFAAGELDTSMDASKTWPPPSLPTRFSALPLHCHRSSNKRKVKRTNSTNPKLSINISSPHLQRGGGGRAEIFSKIPPPPSAGKFSDLPFDVLVRLAAAFDIPELFAASAVCRSWREGLRPLREAMVLLRWGKKFKHGRGVRVDHNRALVSFLRGVERGSAAAMVDAGLMYWEMGRKEEGKTLYARGAKLGHPAAQCNLGICFLEAEPEEAVKWFFRAAELGNSRAQYSLALCLHKGRGVKCNLREAARWYLRAAEGGNVPAMYNTSLCYATGEGFSKDLRCARIWMKRAADCGHRKAQFQHGLELFASGEAMKALVYLELAVRAGEIAATHVKDAIVHSLPQPLLDRAMASVERWRPRQLHRYCKIT